MKFKKKEREGPPRLGGRRKAIVADDGELGKDLLDAWRRREREDRVDAVIRADIREMTREDLVSLAVEHAVRVVRLGVAVWNDVTLRAVAS